MFLTLIDLILIIQVGTLCVEEVHHPALGKQNRGWISRECDVSRKYACSCFISLLFLTLLCLTTPEPPTPHYHVLPLQVALLPRDMWSMWIHLTMAAPLPPQQWESESSGWLLSVDLSVCLCVSVCLPWGLHFPLQGIHLGQPFKIVGIPCSTVLREYKSSSHSEWFVFLRRSVGAERQGEHFPHFHSFFISFFLFYTPSKIVVALPWGELKLMKSGVNRKIE